MSAVAGEGGFQFEIKMAALIGLRGLQRRENFELSSNIDGAGNLDDLMYTAGRRRYFLQLKHTIKPHKKKLTKGDLVNLLKKCFESYRKIRNGKAFEDNQIDKTEFIIYTNKELGDEFSEHELTETENDIFFMTYGKKVFNVNSETTEEKAVYTLFKKSVMGSETSEESLISEFLKELIIVTGQKGHRKLDDLIADEIRNLEEILIADEVRNHEEIQVDPKDYMSILHHFKTPLETWWRNTKRENMTPKMVTKWLQEAKTEHYTPVVRSFTKPVRTGIEFSDSEVSLHHAELSKKRAVHLRSDAVTLCSILLMDCLPQSKCIFVNFECLQSNKDMLLHAWLGGHWEWLIVYCDSTVQQSDISHTCFKMPDIVKRHHSSKRLIILTEDSIELITGFVPVKHEFRFQQLSKKSQAMVLDKKIEFQGCEVTMRSVLQRHGNVEHVLGPELVTDLITEGTAVNIGGKLPVNTGCYAPRVLERKVWLHSTVLHDSKDGIAVSGATKEAVHKIVPRFLKRKIYLKLNVLQNPEFDNDVFAVSGMKKEKLLEIVPSGETVENFNMGVQCDTRGGRFFVLQREDTKACFSELCDKTSGQMLHWLKYKGGELLWKETRGDASNLLDCIDTEKTGIDKRILKKYMKSGSCDVNEESIWDMCERTVLVVAEPGMGKSTTTTQVAWHTKQRDPTSWVVRINWNDHTRILQEIDAETINLDTLVEFLCSAAFPDSKYTDINSSLLKQALQSSGNVTVLMDGFDEISPTYADKAAAILSELVGTKVRRVWVTSRPVQKERLEKELSVVAYGMKKVSRTSQEDMLFVLWKHKAGEEEIRNERLLEFINGLLFNLNDPLHDDNFTGCPLYITMIATVYEMEVETCLNSEDFIDTSIDLVNLYEKFVERKLHIYLTEKQMADITKPSVLDDHEVSKQKLLMNLEKCALAAILPPPMLKSLHNKKIQDELKSFLERVEKGKDKIGIVMNVVEGKPQFVHRTFAEYFTARWFSKNFESNRSVLEDILFDPKYSFMTNMFDRMLAKDCPLHCAVLDRDLNRFETLLNEECDVNAVDNGGRTVMHIIAQHKDERFSYNPYIEFIYGVSYCEVSLDKIDCVLQWTPLQYAIKSEHSFIVEWLLESNVDSSGLDVIRQRAHVTDYIGPTIRRAADYGASLLVLASSYFGLVGLFSGHTTQTTLTQ